MKQITQPPSTWKLEKLPSAFVIVTQKSGGASTSTAFALLLIDPIQKGVARFLLIFHTTHSRTNE